MKNKVSVNLDIDSPYAESNTAFYNFKRKLTYNFVFKILTKYIDPSKNYNILEIGTGSGFFLKYAQEYFPNSSFYAIEYDSRLVEISKKRNPNVFISQGNAELFDFDSITFDFVFSFQVIEHLYHPERMLTNVYKHLNDGGFFLFTTPNLDGYGAVVMKEKWHGYRDDHVSLKGFDDWVKISLAHGFDPIHLSSTFFSGIPILNRFPFGLINWLLLLLFGSFKWKYGESFVGLFKK